MPNLKALLLKLDDNTREAVIKSLNSKLLQKILSKNKSTFKKLDKKIDGLSEFVEKIDINKFAEIDDLRKSITDLKESLSSISTVVNEIDIDSDLKKSLDDINKQIDSKVNVLAETLDHEITRLSATNKKDISDVKMILASINTSLSYNTIEFSKINNAIKELKQNSFKKEDLQNILDIEAGENIRITKILNNRGILFKIDAKSNNSYAVFGNAKSFTSLIDTPSNYKGYSGYQLRVDPYESKLEFFRPTVSFGEIHTHDNTGTQAIPTGLSAYTQTNSFTDSGVNIGVSIYPDQDKIIVPNIGYYRVDSSFSFSCGTNNTTFYGALFMNGAEVDQVHFERKIGTAGDRGNASATGIIGVTQANTQLDIRLKHDSGATVNINMYYANLNIQYIHNIV